MIEIILSLSMTICHALMDTTLVISDAEPLEQQPKTALHDHIPSKHGAKSLMLIYIPRKYYEL
jgi:hypothetical protein